jgi:4'-phosphopantetheinyl transferase
LRKRPAVTASSPLRNRRLAIAKNEIHVWSAVMDAHINDVELYATLLSAGEKRRAARFHFEKDRTRFIVCRGILRILLGAYSRQEPTRVRFRYNKYGKPSMKAGDKKKAFFFNVSHSGGGALLAFSKTIPLGVDLEEMRSRPDFASMVQRFFSPAEAAEFLSLPEKVRPEAFFNCWTRKEAFIKGKEKGLSLGLDQFDVSMRPGEPARLLRTAYRESDVRDWSLFDVPVTGGFKAALAVKSKKAKISIFSWNPSAFSSRSLNTG